MTTTTPGHGPDSTRTGPVTRGTVAFAAFMLGVVGLFQVFQGISAIGTDRVYLGGLDYTFELDLTAWGWFHLLLGLLAVGTGIGLLRGQAWAALVGIALAFVGAVANFAFLPYYPIWSMIVIAVDVIVIWALSHEVWQG